MKSWELSLSVVLLLLLIYDLYSLGPSKLFSVTYEDDEMIYAGLMSEVSEEAVQSKASPVLIKEDDWRRQRRAIIARRR